MDELVHTLSRRGEPVVGRPDVPKDPDLEAGLLLHLPQCRVLDLLAFVGRAFREDPRAVGVPAGEDDLALPVALADDDATGRDGVTHAGRTAGTDAGHRASRIVKRRV